MPCAPASRAASTSCGSSMLACSSIGAPSSVVAGVVRRRLSFCRSSSSCDWRSWYSPSTAGSGATINTPCSPSTISRSFSRIMWRARCKPTIAGMPRLRARIAVWEVTPPRSVTKPPNSCCLNRIMSAGDRSCATTISFCSSDVCGGVGPGWPSSAFSTRSTTCCTSALRSRRYGSSMASNCSTRPSICRTSAHSALQRSARISSRGTSESVESSRIMRCRSTKALNSAGASAGICPVSSRSSPRTSSSAASKRSISASIDAAGISKCATSSRALETRCA